MRFELFFFLEKKRKKKKLFDNNFEWMLNFFFNEVKSKGKTFAKRCRCSIPLQR
jgi:hypothetical protein